MTFEEFLSKKKIDRQQFGLAEPALLAEFAFDYAQMGEKSFDYTKKYWFNQLRRRYKLAEVAKVANVEEVGRVGKVAEVTEAALAKDGTQENLVAESAQPVKEIIDAGSQKPETAPSSKPAFKPRFVLPEKEKQDVRGGMPEQKPDTTPIPKPTFKPRFVPPSKQAIEPATEVISDATEKKKKTTEETPEKSVAKPAFKPRFVPPAKEKQEVRGEMPEQKPDTTPIPKPTFKPRFLPPAKPKE